MRGPAEIIRLDAEVVALLSERTFRAKLENGHELVAYGRDEQLDFLRTLRVGDRIVAKMSPYDMSRGEVIAKKVLHEG